MLVSDGFAIFIVNPLGILKVSVGVITSTSHTPVVTPARFRVVLKFDEPIISNVSPTISGCPGFINLKAVPGTNPPPVISTVTAPALAAVFGEIEIVPIATVWQAVFKQYTFDRVRHT